MPSQVISSRPKQAAQKTLHPRVQFPRRAVPAGAGERSTPDTANPPLPERRPRPAFGRKMTVSRLSRSNLSVESQVCELALNDGILVGCQWSVLPRVLCGTRTHLTGTSREIPSQSYWKQFFPNSRSCRVTCWMIKVQSASMLSFF